MKENKLNDLSSTEHTKFEKSWFIHNPPRRKKVVLPHPAKFPETLAREHIEFFTKKGMIVLDPMVGTGSTLIACIRSGRNGYGIELNQKYAEIAKKEVSTEKSQLLLFEQHPKIQVFNSDAKDILQLNIPKIDYCITSPPYWDMLRMKGADTQKNRQNNKDLDVYYSDDPKDLWNISDYDTFVEALVNVYRNIYDVMRDGAYITIIGGWHHQRQPLAVCRGFL